MKLEPTGNEAIDGLNRKLADVYGCDVASDNSRYRIVWADNQTEYRNGTFVDFDEKTGYFQREVTETRLCLKYPNNPECWVLEKFQYNISNPDLPSRVSYEPLWVYGACNSDPNPDWPHTEILVNVDRIIKRRAITNSELKEIDDNKLLAEKAKFKAMIQNDSEYLVGAMLAGGATSVNGFRDIKKGQENGND